MTFLRRTNSTLTSRDRRNDTIPEFAKDDIRIDGRGRAGFEMAKKQYHIHSAEQAPDGGFCNLVVYICSAAGWLLNGAPAALTCQSVENPSLDVAVAPGSKWPSKITFARPRQRQDNNADHKATRLW